MAGAYAYAEVARRVPRSGGEYRYLSELLHPVAGYLAGWASLLVGFSAPVAINAVSASAFLDTVVDVGSPRLVAAGIIVVMTAVHGLDLGASKNTQNALIGIKVALLAGFCALGLFRGSFDWPSWSPPSGATGFEASPFAISLFFIAFAFSGWNSAVYAAEEFRRPDRDVPRAMVIGCALVALFYLVVNWVFVANITPERASAVLRYETDHITLGHIVARDLIGDTGARLMSLLAVIAFVSAISAMTMVGPRVASAMARDGFLPSWFVGREGKPPLGAVILQSGIALLLLSSHSVREALANVSAILVLFSALTVGCLFWSRPRAPAFVLGAAVIYVGSSGWMLYNGFKRSWSLLVWVGIVAIAAITTFVLTRAVERR
jgi:APA family basic amino acid/polyamine antiporter